ncbi:hypothetical protein E2542_SST29567 [Spatholobus suberectus]|nr:hypothetical protein E2542_SST29567 [Spatholobus suberectus]
MPTSLVHLRRARFSASLRLLAHLRGASTNLHRKPLTHLPYRHGANTHRYPCTKGSKVVSKQGVYPFQFVGRVYGLGPSVLLPSPFTPFQHVGRIWVGPICSLESLLFRLEYIWAKDTRI